MQLHGNKWWQIAGAGYLVLMVFATGYFATPYFKDDTALATQVTVGILLAAPLAIAFLWERLRSVKVFGVGIELDKLTVDIVPADPALEDAIAAQQYYSGKDDILEQISKTVDIPNKQVFEINLRAKRPYWWSTRLYLQAALLMDHSSISHVVFVEGTEQRRFIGITRIETLRQALANILPCLETIYRELTAQNLSMNNLVHQWVAAAFDGKAEIDVKSLISSQDLESILAGGLEQEAVESSGTSDSQLYRPILAHGGEFVALTKKGRLARIIDANALARQLAVLPI